ncbi:MAG: alanine--tRNA ligase-related protein [Candidatus Sigynarchaeota archaeon]
MTATRKDFWQDPYQVAFQARVVKVTRAGIVLDHTCFYPASGNQASDKGTLVIGGKKYDVQEVLKDGEEIIHVVKPSALDDVAIDVFAEGTVDWTRRYALMRGHTAQHVLSACLLARFGASTGEASIQPDAVSISVKKQISLKQLQEALAVVNVACTTTHPVIARILPRERAVAEFSERLRGEIPSEDPVRIVEIKDLDLMCCGGTHVKETAEIGPLLVTKFKGGREIKFVVGSEAAVSIAKANAAMLSAAATLNKDIFQLADAVEKQSMNLKALDDQVDSLSIALLEQEAKAPGLLTSGGLHVHVVKDITNKNILATWFNKFPPESILVVQGSQGSLRIYSNSDAVKANELVQLLVAREGGKGGGNPKVAQGILEKDPGDFLALLQDVIARK